MRPAELQNGHLEWIKSWTLMKIDGEVKSGVASKLRQW